MLSLRPKVIVSVPIAQEALPVCLMPMTRVTNCFRSCSAIGIGAREGHCMTNAVKIIIIVDVNQCSQPSSPSVLGGGRDGLWLVVRLFWGARTDYARQGKDRTDYRGL